MPSQPLFSKPFFFAYLAILFWAPWPFAGYNDWAMNLQSLLILSLAAVMALALLLRGGDCFAPLRRHWLPISLFFVAPLWVTLQTLPMSSELLAQLSPRAAELQGYAGLQQMTISLEPSVTRREALLSWSLWLFFVMTLLLVDSGQRAKTLITTIVVCGVLQALYGSFMTLTGIEYSFFQPKNIQIGSATGTHLSRNHFAGQLEMCLALGIGLLVGTLNPDQGKRSWRQIVVDSINTLLGPKMRLRIFLAIMVIALVLSRSRMGNTAFFLSLPLCGVLLMILQRKLHKGAIILFASLILIDVLIVSQWFGLDEVAARMQATSAEAEIRDENIIDVATKMLPDFQLTGSGLGTFMETFIPYDTLAAYDYVTNTVHNDYLEMLVEIGWIGFAPLALLVLSSLFMAARSMASRRTQLYRGLGFGALMGMISILIHSFVDFNLQIPANALLFVVLLALARLAASLERGGRQTRRRSGRGVLRPDPGPHEPAQATG